MKKTGVVLVSLCSVGCLVGWLYRGPIMDLGRAFISEVNYMFSINGENASKIKTGSDNALAAKVLKDIEIDDSVESPSWQMESAAGEVFNEMTERLPFIEKVGNWIEENVLKRKGIDAEGTSSESTNNEGNTSTSE